MRVKSILLLGSVCAVIVVAGSGCVTSVDGRKHAGMPFTSDTMQAKYEREVMEVWTAAEDVLNYNGRLYSKDIQKSTMEAAINQRTVWVKVEAVGPKMTKVTVQARTKFGGGDPAVAGEIDKQIALRLAAGNYTATRESNGAATKQN